MKTERKYGDSVIHYDEYCVKNPRHGKKFKHKKSIMASLGSTLIDNLSTDRSNYI